MNEAEVRRTAKALAALQLQMFPAHLMDGFRGELSLLDLAALGLTMVTSASELLTPDRLSFKVTPTMASVILQARGNPAILEDYFYEVIAESGISAEQMVEASRAIRAQLEEPGIVRGLMKEAVKTLLPAQKAGRPAKLDRSDWPVLLETSERLRPLCLALTRLERYAKSRSLEDNLRYLKPDFPEAVEFLWRYLDQAKVLLSDRTFLSRVKSPKARNVRLADALAGLQFKLTAKYATQQAARARSATRNQ
ncbi:hypothetical protein [Edaphobacter bradus]|uniref:hypothetical protein n=1 Tax=Edaphobacter bradus TaxID=2259016 RepID=UPI0021DFFAE3|nr:hypothetical protein [Edaphobacter bradus]